jgi:hypothetical protein
MINPNNVPPVDDDELLARFILNSNEFRGDDSVRPALFMPYKKVALSVNRHRDASLEETWQIGHAVAAQRMKTLYGRSDITVRACKVDSLSVVAKPLLAENPNHAEIVGYPPTREDQKSLAQVLAAAASRRIGPPS